MKAEGRTYGTDQSKWSVHLPNLKARAVKFALNLACILAQLIFAVCITADVVSAQYSPPTGVSRPASHPRETGLPGDSYLQAIKRYTNIGANGDLHINLPLFTVGDQLPVPIELSYSSAVTLDQPASNAGLGWNVANWSVRRITIHGDDPMARDYHGETNSRYHVNDAFRVTIPGRSLLFINTGSMSQPVFTPLSYSNDSLYVKDSTIVLASFYYSQYKYFIMTDDAGTRYVFQQPLRRLCIQGPVDDFLPDISAPFSENSEWLLTAILDHDYVDGGGDSLNPLDSPSPRIDNHGAWVAFVYADNRMFEGHVTDVLMGPYSPGDGSGYIHKDSLQTAYLTKIITGTTVAELLYHPPLYYHTIKYQRTGSDDQYRKKDLYIAQIKLKEYSGVGTAATGPELAGVTFNYECGLEVGGSRADTTRLKEGYHQFVAQTRRMHGEPTLRSVVFGTDISYDYGYGWYVQPLTGDTVVTWTPCNLCQKVSHGGKRKYSFEYDSRLDTTSYYPLGVYDSNRYDYFSTVYRRWHNGFVHGDFYGLWPNTDIVLSCIHSKDWLDEENIIDTTWGGRDYFGFQWQYPYAWSLTKLTTPEGLVVKYEYESDKFKLGANAFEGGGSRVKSVIMNGGRLTGDWESSDYSDADTIRLTYGYGGDGIGYPTSMPANYWSFRTCNTGNILYSVGRYYSTSYEYFLGDNAVHEIQYPQITWHLPRNRGFIEHYYTTSDSVAGNQRHSMSLGPFRLGQSDHFFYHYYSVWHDRSPMLGVPYKTIQKDESGREVDFEERSYSWPVITALTFAADHGYETDSSDNFSVGDTIAASYFVQLDSVIHRRDGVQWSESYHYDDLKRLSRHSVQAHGVDRITARTYASYTTPAMRSRHYLAAVTSVKERESDGTYDSLRARTRFEYRSDFPSQNRSGTNAVWYQSASKQWVDVNDNNVAEADEDVATTVLDVNSYGKPILLTNERGVKGGAVHDYAGNEATFENVDGNDFAVFTGEAEMQAPNVTWSWGDHGAADSVYSFTGRKCAMVSSHSGVMTFGPTAVFRPTLSGLYIAECWARCADSNKARLAIATNTAQTGYNDAAVTRVNDWQHLVCSLTVPTGDTLRVYAKTFGTDAYFDDIRVYRTEALARSQTVDGLGRVSSQTDENGMPKRSYYNDDDEQAAVADYRKVPRAGTERFWTRDAHHGRSPLGYNSTTPNQQYEFQCRGTGLIEDFRNNPLPNWTLQGPALLNYDVAQQKLQFNVPSGSAEYYKDVWVPVGGFADGFLALDVYRTPGSSIW